MRRIVFGIMLVLLFAYSSATILIANSAAGPSIVISPDITTPPSRTFILNMTINDATDIRAWEVTLVYQKIITLDSVDTINDTTFTDGPGLAISKQEDYNSTYYQSNIARTTLNIVPGAGTGSGLVAQLHFSAVSIGTTAITVIDSGMMNSQSRFEDITPVSITTPTIIVAIPPSPPPSQPVGGISFSLAKAATLAPYIGLASIAAVAIIATTVYFKGIKRRKEKQ